mmetsp:Transcript_17183/g.32829  ORF Transcript_17183/g.32829 Transcript_17183/m.32829 type:complete len:227 (-) Transcript_17183:372-1052(-)
MTSKFARTRVQLLSCIFVAAQVHSDIHDGDPFVGVSLHERAQAADGVWPQPIVKIQLPQGSIRIRLLPNLAQSSVDFVLRVAKQDRCSSSRECKFYRAERNFLLQGSMRSQVQPNTQLGVCPPEFVGAPRSSPCPSHDPDCGCHGPVMVPGMVGWAGGGAGPDFFIYAGDGPATHWNNDHTVWGELADEASTKLVHSILTLPVHRPPHGMAMLARPIHFEITLMQS